MPSKTAVARAEAFEEGRSARKHLMIWLLASALVAVLVAGWLGWFLNDQNRTQHSVQVTSTFSGTVTRVTPEGSGGCVQPDGGGRPVCTVFAVVEGARVHQGEHVRAAHEHASVVHGGSTGYDLLLIYSDSGD